MIHPCCQFDEENGHSQSCPNYTVKTFGMTYTTGKQNYHIVVKPATLQKLIAGEMITVEFDDAEITIKIK